MAGWSSLQVLIRGSPSKFAVGSQICRFNVISAQQRMMSGGHGPRILPLTPSRWQWHKFKDLAHYYFMIGLIPVGLVVFYANVFVGPAKLSEIPEGYEPKHWEYHRNPITRFIARYLLPSPQQEYEKFLHQIYEEDEKAKIRLLENKIRAKMAERHDYQGYYTRPFTANYHRVAKEAAEYLESIRGD
ncbi:NADH dehydrogenase [ubiquinone] 1 beta subcomplex subunit 5, mitochondrial [Periplaneta americana]|uniref:NADH dehydrogenase [ubiquinone] 1 beta subcomplex subunit 5, mitochondrial n=1 Tax=Periplaneta americana TaxID=6978 RepID=UPI0037E78F76